MKNLRIASVLLSAVICMSLFPAPVVTKADETTTSETSASGSETAASEPSQTDRFTVVKETTSRTVSGMCGDKTSWLLDNSGTLTVSGFGDMNSWTSSDLVPWNNYKDSIHAVVISSGVTSVGERAFEGCKNLETVNISQTVTKIGDFAFADCTSLNRAVLDENLYNSSNGIFDSSSGVEVSFIASYPVVVHGGTSDVSKACEGTTVTLTPDAAPEGKVFDCWTVNHGEVVLNSSEDGTATFVMPASYVEITASFKDNEPKNNTLTVRTRNAKLKARKLKKKAQKISRSKVMTVSNAQGSLSYKLVSVSRSRYKKYFKVNSSNGTVTVKKKLKKGTYTVKCRVTASGNNEYKAMSRTVTFKITVR